MRENGFGGLGGLCDNAEAREGHFLLVVGEFMVVCFKLCFLDDRLTPGVTDKERVEEIHGKSFVQR